jgi:hypothetical protein
MTLYDTIGSFGQASLYRADVLSFDYSMLQQESIRMFIQMREIQVQRRNSRGT